MIKTCLRLGILFFLSTCSLVAYTQNDEKSTLVTIQTLEKDYYKPKETTEKPAAPVISTKEFYRHHKKLPVTFDGYVIELTSSDFPLKRDYHLFEQFGKVYYDQVENIGYSYLIIADFSSKKAMEEYVQNVIKHKAPEARVVQYNNGKRMTKTN